MKSFKFFFLSSLMLGLIFFSVGCGDDDSPPEVFTLSSVTAGTIDLAGATSATDVPNDAVIVATFSSEVDATTANTTNITLTDDNATNVPLSLSTSGNAITITPTAGLNSGTLYTLVLSSGIAGTNSVIYTGNVLTFRTGGIFVPKSENQVLHLSFDGGVVEDGAKSHTVTSSGIAFGADRQNTANSAAYFDGTGGLVEVAASSDLVNTSTTISFWMNTASADYNGQDGQDIPQTRFVTGLGVEKGFMLETGRRSKDPLGEAYDEFFFKFATNHTNVGDNAGSNPHGTAWTEVNSQLTVNAASDQNGWSYAIPQLSADPPNRGYLKSEAIDKWIHFVMTHDVLSKSKTFYINGVKMATFKWADTGDWLLSDFVIKPDVPNLETSLALGYAGSAANKATGWADHEAEKQKTSQQKFFKGFLDEYRIFDIALSEADVLTLYENEK